MNKSDEMIRRGDVMTEIAIWRPQPMMNLIDAINAIPPVSSVVTINPLKWEKDGIGRTVANSIVGTYIVEKNGWARASDRNLTLSDTPFADAQADYDARVRKLFTVDTVKPQQYMATKRVVELLEEMLKSQQTASSNADWDGDSVGSREHSDNAEAIRIVLSEFKRTH